jgi:multidrug resistance efflux pump
MVNPATDARRSPAPGPDLTRLRIERGEGARGGYRGFPWVRAILLLSVAGVAFLYREPLLSLFQGVRAPEVRTARVQRVVPGEAAEGDVSANGYVVANRTTSVATVLSGRLVQVNAEEGDVVEQDAVVGRIQFDDLEAEHEAAKERQAVAEAEVEAARADVAAAELDLPRLEAVIEAQQEQIEETLEQVERLEREVERNRKLFDEKVIDEGTWDRVQADARVARQIYEAAQARARANEAQRVAWQGEIARRRAALAVAEARVKTSRRQVLLAWITLDKTYIRAPFRGLVIRKDAELGEVVAPTGAGGRGSVFTIVDPESLEMQVELSESRILKVNEGDEATIFLDADPETAHPATVRKIWPRADRSKGTIEVRVAFVERPALLRPEMAGRVVFRGEREREADPGEPWLGVVLSGETVSRRGLTVGETRGGLVVVENGLAEGEEVVLDPDLSWTDGQRVRRKAR